jgi:hypothetical protein
MATLESIEAEAGKVNDDGSAAPVNPFADIGESWPGTTSTNPDLTFWTRLLPKRRRDHAAVHG